MQTLYYINRQFIIQMAKKLRSKVKGPSQNLPEFQINKKKSFAVNLNSYIKMLEKKHP